MATEKRLIDANEALRMMRNSQHDTPCTDKTGKGVWDIAHNCAISCVNACPTVDAVEVVRCENCIHCYQLIIDENGHWKEVKKGGTHNLCTRHDESFDVTCNGFCSYGERREGE